jgi:hypothetical protein
MPFLKVMDRILPSKIQKFFIKVELHPNHLLHMCVSSYPAMSVRISGDGGWSGMEEEDRPIR